MDIKTIALTSVGVGTGLGAVIAFAEPIGAIMADGHAWSTMWEALERVGIAPVMILSGWLIRASPGGFIFMTFGLALRKVLGLPLRDDDVTMVAPKGRREQEERRPRSAP